MKLQGVIILRISDFRRFFDIEEFMAKKDEFGKLLSVYGASFFCDTPEEIALCGLVRNWINKVVLTAELKEGYLVIPGTPKLHIPLGSLKEQVDKYYGKVETKGIVALTALYLLAGVNLPGSAITPDYSILLSGGNDSFESGYITVFGDRDFPSAQDMGHGPFNLGVIANNAGRKVTISAGTKSMELNDGEATTAIFSKDGCVALLQNEVSDLPRVHAVMVGDKAQRRANLRLSHDGVTETIEGVTSVWIEPGAGVGYTLADGSIVYDTDRCYRLRNRMAVFNGHANGRKLLAAAKTDNGNYVMYTDQQIDY